MTSGKTHCDETCKEFCASLETASASEANALSLYVLLRDRCTYPEIQELLNELIEKRKEIIKLIEETQSRLKSKFHVLDQITRSFEE